MSLLTVYDRVIKKRYHLGEAHSERHFIFCDDGVCLSLKRFRAESPAEPNGQQILCIPGLAADSHNFDSPPERNLATDLSSSGYDVWVIDLRGTGRSQVTDRVWRSISFDTYAQIDIPTAITYIQQTTGRKQIHLIGHSMGGLCIYGLLGFGENENIQSCVTLNSPLGFSNGWAALPWLGRISWLANYLPGLRVKKWMRRISPLVRRPWEPISSILAPPDSMDPALSRRLLYHSTEDIPPGVMLQFADWLSNDVFRSLCHKRDYRSALKGVHTPVMVVAGPADQIAPMDSVLRSLDLLERGTSLICGTGDGFSYNYGHIDTVLGHNAHREVFPEIKQFLQHYKTAEAC
jgi:pimeloyl-ACP methyl ester carboxylesterase